MKENSEKSLEAEFLNKDYDISQFKSDLTSGKLRWFATILAFLNLGFLVFSYFDTEELEVHFPIHLKGDYLIVLFFITLLIWIFLAAKNWKVWLKQRNKKSHHNNE